MAHSWRTDAQQIVNNVGNTLSSVAAKTADYFGTSIKNDIEQAATLFKNGVNVVGINVGGIGSMKDAIDSYVSDVDAAINNLQNVKGTDAFAGEYKTAMENYIAACIEACSCVVSNMLEFKVELEKVQKAYETKDENVSSAINKDAESTRSTYTRYGGSAK